MTSFTSFWSSCPRTSPGWLSGMPAVGSRGGKLYARSWASISPRRRPVSSIFPSATRETNRAWVDSLSCCLLSIAR
eukprot:scaffold108870_cov33-Tisochrysis_lutea.AAC.3